MEVKKRYYKISELQTNTLSSLKNKEIFVKGSDCGFKVGDEFISYRIGFSTSIYSYKSEGKTQFTLQQAVHLSVAHGWKHALWLSESGKKSEAVLDIVMCYLGKSLFSGDYISDDEILEALLFLNDFFYFIDHEKSMLNIRDIYEIVAEIEQTEGIKISGVIIDNATNLAREQTKSSLMIHEYMNYLMTAVNRTSLSKGYHTFILFHVGKPESMAECKTSGKKFRPCPSDFSILGGQQTGYLGFQMFSVWRPCRTIDDYGIINPKTGVPYAINETVITVTKSKPKKIGIEGSFHIYFDIDKQQYYEIIGNEKFYCGSYNQILNPTAEATPSALQPSKSFTDIF